MIDLECMIKSLRLVWLHEWSMENPPSVIPAADRTHGRLLFFFNNSIDSQLDAYGIEKTKFEFA